MGQRIVRVTGELIRQILKLPADCIVTGLSEQLFFSTDEWAIRLESPEFPEVLPGNAIPMVSPMYSASFVDGKTVAEFVGWDGPYPPKQLATLQAGPGENYNCLGSPPVVPPLSDEVKAQLRADILAKYGCESEKGQPATRVKFREFF